MKKGGRPKPRANNPKREVARAGEEDVAAHAGVKEALWPSWPGPTPGRSARRKPLNAEPPWGPPKRPTGGGASTWRSALCSGTGCSAAPKLRSG